MPRSLYPRVRHPCNVPPRLRDARDETAANRITSALHDDGDRLGRVLGRHAWGPARHDDVNLEADQFGRKGREPIGLVLSVSILDRDVLALDLAELPQPPRNAPHRRGAPAGALNGIFPQRMPIRKHLPCLLGLGGNRRGEERTREVPRNARRSSLDHLVRPRQQRRRDRQAEGLRGLEVDDQLELGGLLDREVAGLGAPEDPVDVDRYASTQVVELFALYVMRPPASTPHRLDVHRRAAGA